MYTNKPSLYIIKGTDDKLAFQRQGPYGKYEGNTNIDLRIDKTQFDQRGIFINPLAFPHVYKLLEKVDGPIFNAITDPDISPLCLAALNKALKQAPRSIINHPQGILQTRRDEVAKKLAGIEGLVVPKCARVISRKVADIAAAVQMAKMRYPLIVRSIAAHNQQHLLKINAPEELRLAEKLPGKGWYITEYIECRSLDGLYRNYRFFVFSTGKIVPRHVDIGPDWKVGIHVRKSFMADRKDLLDEVLAYVNNFEEIVGAGRLKTLQTIRSRLGLDYLGIDCNLLPSGELLLFEANVAMNADAGKSPDGKFEHLEITLEQLNHAFTELIQSKSMPSTSSKNFTDLPEQ